MGTTRSFIVVQNKDFSLKDIKTRINALSMRHKAVVAYNENSKWLPYFETTLCDGNIVLIEDIKKLSQILEAPILAFAIFDSDYLYLSYCDASHEISFNHVKPNIEEIGEEDAIFDYSTDFPEFLFAFCSSDESDRLRDVWNDTEVVFADDRMHDICELIGATVIYDENDIEGEFQAVYAR